MTLTIGIDIGGSTTKIVGLRENTIFCPLIVRAGDPITSAYGAFGRFLIENDLTIGDIDKVMFTGVGSSFIKESIYGIPTEKVDEFMAVGLGGRYISDMKRIVVVSMGTGTALVSVDGDEIIHMGGTGVGGGTVIGLADKIFNIREFEHIVDLARDGNLGNVDLSIGDISNTTLSNMELKTTASNFGKLSDVATSADLALGVINLVLQTIGMVAIFAGRSKNICDIVLTGNLSTLDFTRSIFDEMEKLYDVRFYVLENSDFATAIGAAIYGK